MATSITASTVSPFNSYLLSDANFVATAAFGGSATTASTSALNFQTITPWPETSRAITYVYNTTAINTSGSVLGVFLQESSDTVTWNNVVGLANPLVSTTDTSGTGSANNGNFSLQPTAKQYLRACVITPTRIDGGGATGSFGVKVFFP